MSILDAILAIIVAAVAVSFIRPGIMKWRNAGTPLSQWSVTAFMDRDTRAGMDRGGLIVGLGLAFFAVMLAAGAFALPHPDKGAQLVAGVVALAALFAMAGCIAVALSIIHFNRPKFLVPPQHRGELGALASRRRRRKGLPVSPLTEHRPDGDGQAPVLATGERIVARFVTNHVQDGRGPTEGHMYVTSTRLVFVPVKASRVRGEKSLRVPLAQVSEVDVAPRVKNYPDGSLRRRLRVRTIAGDTELFVVWRPRKAARLVEQAHRAHA
jgi:hypothetical protein